MPLQTAAASSEGSQLQRCCESSQVTPLGMYLAACGCDRDHEDEVSLLPNVGPIPHMHVHPMLRRIYGHKHLVMLITNVPVGLSTQWSAAGVSSTCTT